MPGEGDESPDMSGDLLSCHVLEEGSAKKGDTAALMIKVAMAGAQLGEGVALEAI